MSTNIINDLWSRPVLPIDIMNCPAIRDRRHSIRFKTTRRGVLGFAVALVFVLMLVFRLKFPFGSASRGSVLALCSFLGQYMGPKPIPEWEFELLRERRARRLQRERTLRIGRWYHLAFLAWLEDYGAQVALVRACQRLVDALEVERLGDEWELVLAGWIGGRGLAVPAPNADPLLLQLPWRED